jgi:hypothetical protein
VKALLEGDLIMKHQLCESVMNELNDILDRIGVDILLGSSLIRTTVTIGNVYIILFSQDQNPSRLIVTPTDKWHAQCLIFSKSERKSNRHYSFTGAVVCGIREVGVL